MGPSLNTGCVQPGLCCGGLEACVAPTGMRCIVSIKANGLEGNIWESTDRGPSPPFERYQNQNQKKVDIKSQSQGQLRASIMIISGPIMIAMYPEGLLCPITG